MDELQIFKNDEFGEVRALMINDEPYFVGKDVATILGYKDTFQALKSHVDDEDKQNCKNNSFESNRGLTIINESGLYSLILSSKLPAAKKFKRWVTSDVLPSIRKTGGYQLPTEPMDVLKLMFEAQTQTNEKVAIHDRRIQELEENKLLNPGEYNYISRAVKRKVKSVMNDLDMELENKQRSKIYHAINRDLNCFIGIKTRSQFKAKDFDKALDFIENWQLSYTDKRLIEQMSFNL